jgi:predicted ATPase
MADVWAAHDATARELLPAFHGREIDKTDGFLMLFERASDAVAYALAYHRALRDVSARLGIVFAARAGLHVGPVTLRENPAEHVARGAKPLEVEGIAKAVGARVMAIAGAGQTLLTATAADGLPDGLRLQSHGHWRLKGVAEPLELFEAGEDDAPFTPPPDAAKAWRVVRDADVWVPVRDVPHRVPAERDAFVGREKELVALARMIDDGARLVTVLGAGGTGKTRFATRFARTWVGDYAGGVWFCDLSEARDAEGIARAVATGLDVPLGQEEPVGRVGHAIAGRGACLVVLDNFEQVSHLAPETVGRWLDRAGEAVFVVTSRQILGLPGEATLPLDPLPEADAVALFGARARQARPDVAEGDAAIAELVRLLDGLPLAIELAAARARVMSPATLLQRMSERFRLLAAPGRSARQSTLRATLDWSWDLLGSDEKAALAQLSVFEGGFTLEAAEAVLALEEAWPIDAVQALVDRSLVRQAAGERFTLLVSIQEYASERLEPDARDAAEERHAGYYARLGAETPEIGRETALAPDLHNLLAATRRAAAQGAGRIAGDALISAWAVLEQRGPVHLAGDLARTVLALPDVPRRAEIQRVLGHVQHLSGRTSEAVATFAGALAEAEETGDDDARVALLVNLGSAQSAVGQIEAGLASYQAAIALARQRGRLRSEAHGLGNLGNLFLRTGRHDEARESYEAAGDLYRRLGDRRGEARMLANRAELHLHWGRAAEALPLFEQALPALRELGDALAEAHVATSLATLHDELGHPEEALAHAHAGLARSRSFGHRRQEGVSLLAVGNVHHTSGRLGAARAAYEAALVVHREVQNVRTEGVTLGNLAEVARLEGRFDEATALLDAALVIHRRLGNRRSEAMAHYYQGLVARDRGRPTAAREHVQAALGLFEALGSERLQRLAQDVLAELGAQVEGEPFAAEAPHRG